MSTASYDTASHRAAPRRATSRRAASHRGVPSHDGTGDDSWLDSWEAGHDPGYSDPRGGVHSGPHGSLHADPPGSVPGYFAPRIYRGRSVDELIPTIVAELGEDAVVIRHHRGLSGGFAGFFQKAFVEIEARRGDPGGSLLDRYDEDDAAPALPGDDALTPANDIAPAPLRQATRALPSEFEEARALPGEFEEARAPVTPEPLDWNGATEVWATNPFAAALAEAEAAVRAAEPAVPPDLDAALAEALADAEEAQAPEEIVAAPLPDDLEVEPAAAPPPATVVVARPAEPTPPGHDTTPPATPYPNATPLTPEPSARAEIEQTLRAVGIGEQLVQELLEAAITHVLPLMPPATSLARAVHTALTQMIPASRPLPAAGAAIAVVGAGGSGKSACCAALVEAYREHGTLPAACVTVSPDTELDEPALREARAQGLLVLDTPTVSSADPTSIDALAELLVQLRPDRVVLALPATLGATPAAQLLAALGPLGADALAITHADETDQLGVAAQTACAFRLAPIHLLARAESAPRSWALSWIDPHLLANRLLPPR
jgi:flagellar biosynthesis protein FlhF